MNFVAIAGRIGQVREMRKAGATDVIGFSVATSESYKDSSGQWQDATTWHDCESWGAQAGYVQRHLGPGDVVAVVGKVDVQEWERDGQKHRKHVVRVDKVERLSKKESRQ